MIRKIIRIDEEKCNGCGLCAEACHEGAIDIVDGKISVTGSAIAFRTVPPEPFHLKKEKRLLMTKRQ